MFEEYKIKGRPIYRLKHLGETVAMCCRTVWGRWEVKGVSIDVFVSAKRKSEAIKLFEEQYKLFLRGVPYDKQNPSGREES
ncbi:hypothetical protein P4159_05720 [Bacillus thuringiensis]|uniref:hypothetical protein n=1 Tax=Bacillus cereus group TaxID=86661 RepID=UPI000CD8302D|nr:MULTISPECIES: hypothetical protein [Bacillus cereus group]MEC3417091.1 hypothetical protein [Bacillus cereus]MEC3596910.1 hypothetical protein [Bacillus thuringiensis]MED1574259.1 hypothetical protein [Bacillus paranthracis]MED1836183.1 hypothetical protein [Bacillus thuringiensis]MED2670246.1 hypothetical protein [Bacillus thuringiensis]